MSDELPKDILRHILTFVPLHNIHHLCSVNKLFNHLCNQPILYSNYVCRLKCFSRVPLTIKDKTRTFSIAFHDEYNNNYIDKNFQHKSQTKDLYSMWFKRLQKCQYFDMGSFPLDLEHLSNEIFKDAITNIVSLNKNLCALHFDGFYSDETKTWFLSFILPKLSSKLKHISLKWDNWAMATLQEIDIFSTIFNTFWVSIDGHSRSFDFPRRLESKITFERLKVLSIYRMYFPNQTLQSLLLAVPNLKILYMFASNWNDDDNPNYKCIMLPKGLRSVSILLCGGIVLLDNCRNDLKHIMIDSPNSNTTKSIFQQLTNGNKYTNLQQFDICFWEAISDTESRNETEKALDIVVDLIGNIHQHGQAIKLNKLTINVVSVAIRNRLKEKLIQKLEIIYGNRQQLVEVTELEKLWENSKFIFDNDEDARFVKDLSQRKFGLLRNT